MMQSAVEMRLLLTVDQAAAERVNRLRYAIDMLASGEPRVEVQRSVIRRFGLSRWTAWRLVSMAADMTEPQR